ncbi:MAG: flagellar protein FlaG [Candidatus Muirbacterium halophilum]|nr:flagellar protein FlaG [Candidatus Muirbacterium halophilum]MCK9474760.1 flagellar protein FlaG [Candidatus Muirbacterium halophilum]
MKIDKVIPQDSVVNVENSKKQLKEKNNSLALEKQNEFKMNMNSKEEENIKKEIESINKLADTYSLKRNLEFSVKDKQIVIKVLDDENNVIREIPPEKILEFRAKFKEVLGLFIDQQL